MAYRTTVFEKLSRSIRRFREALPDNRLFPKLPTPSDDLDEKEYSKKVNSAYSTYYLQGTFLDAVTSKIRAVSRSRRIDLYLVCSWMWTVALSILVFSAIHFGLYRLSPSSFDNASDATWLNFLGYSVCVFFPADLSPITPISPISTALGYFEVLVAFVIVAILVFSVLTSARDVYQNDLEELGNELETTGEVIAAMTKAACNKTLSEIERALLNDNVQMVNQMRRMRGLSELSPDPANLVDPDVGGTDAGDSAQGEVEANLPAPTKGAESNGT